MTVEGVKERYRRTYIQSNTVQRVGPLLGTRHKVSRGVASAFTASAIDVTMSSNVARSSKQQEWDVTDKNVTASLADISSSSRTTTQPAKEKAMRGICAQHQIKR